MGLSLPRLSAAFLLACLSFSAFSQVPIPTSPINPRDTLAMLAERERQRTADPATGTVPYERLAEAREQLIRRSATNPNGAPGTGQAGIPSVTWQERGPSNSGGRTRTLLFDPSDATRKKVWAGSPAGGLWYTNDITDANATWTPVSDMWESLVVTTLAADPTNPQIIYAGTGDYYGGITGGGIWETTNGGTTWTRLSNTIPNNNTYGSVSSSFAYIQRIVVNSSGQVFVATQYGIVRSTDGGSSWQYALAPNQGIGAGTNTGNTYNDRVTDLELGADGILYAAFNPSRVFKATNASGTSWTEITPPGITGERTELALASSTSGTGQILYGVSRKYNNVNYNQDITWFKKSSNGGTTWTDVAIPTPNGSTSHFTYGNGGNYLNLAVSPTDPNTVYAGGSGWYRSTNGGASWGSQSGYGYQQGLWFQPGSAVAAAFATENGVFWSVDWESTDWTYTGLSYPAYSQRSTGLRIGEVVSASMKPAPGGSSLLTGIKNLGHQQINGSGLSTGSSLYGTGGGALLNFIDTDDPTLQIIQSYNVFLRYGTNGSTQLVSLNSYGTPTPADYDSQSNTLYVADYNYATSQYFIRRITGVDASPQSTTFAVPGLTNYYPGYFKLNASGTTLLVGSYLGKLFKITNLSQPTPTVITIDNGAFPQYSSISCIDVGANDNELLVTLSNYGVASVWFTNNGGDVWVNKDQTNFGLPDVPVRTALFNPTSRKQVLLGTDAGIWSTDDIIAPNPGWQYTGGGMVPMQINQLRYRASDGRVTAATNGRGVWQTDALAVPYTPSTLVITNISNSLLCAGSTFSVSYNASGSAFAGTPTVEVWLSDATGNFANQRKVATGTSSPISVTLPAINSGAYPYGTNYRVRLVAPAQDINSEQSGPVAIGDLWNAFATDRTGGYNGYSTSNSICPGGRVTLTVYSRGSNNVPTQAEGYQWSFNGNSISGATSQTLSVQQAGNYQTTVRQAGCTIQAQYTLTITNSPYTGVQSAANGLPQCSGIAQTVRSSYAGEGATYQWRRDGSDIAGATADTLSVSQSGTYSFRLTDGSCVVNTSGQTLSFGSSLYARATRSAEADSVICQGSYNSPYLSAEGIFSNATAAGLYTIQWYRNNVAIGGANREYYYPYQPGSYTFDLKQGSCSTRSNALIVYEGTAIAPPTISQSYGDDIGQTACPGETRLLNVYGYNSTYQWQRDGVDIAGATSGQYAAQVSGSYTCRITRYSCQATSAPLSLTFSNTIRPAVITNGSTNGIGCTVNYLQYASAGQSSGYQYQWLRDGTNVNGGTSGYLTVSQSGSYTLRVTNGACTGLSTPVTVQLGQAAKPLVKAGPSAQACSSNTVRLTATGYQGSLQWKRNGVVVSGETRSTFYATQSGVYSVVHQDNTCSTESNAVQVTLGEPTRAMLSGTASTSAGQAIALPVTFTGPAPWAVTLTNGLSASAVFQNPYSFTVAPASTTTYQLASVNNACGSGTVSGLAVVTVASPGADVSLAMSVSNRTPRVDEPVEFTIQVNNDGPLTGFGVRVSSRLPPNMIFVDSPSPDVVFSGDSVRIQVDSIVIGNTLTFRFRAKATQPGVFITAAQVVGAYTSDPDSQPDSGTEDGQDDATQLDLRTPDAGGAVFVSPNPRQKPLPPVQDNQPPTEPNKADLSLSMAASTLTPQSGEVFSLSLTVSNRGGANGSVVYVKALLPTGWELASNNGLLTVEGQTVGGLLPDNVLPGKQSTLVLQLRATAAGIVKGQIFTATPADSDSILGNGYDNGEDDEAGVSVRVLN